jgi:Peptidase family M23
MQPKTLIRFLTVPTVAALLCVGQPIAAEEIGENSAEIQLQFPLDCTLGETCWVARYTDRKQGKGKADYTCGRRTQHRHRGTDFVINDYGQMAKGVPVLAAMDGIVLRLRDGVKDQPVTRENAAEIKKIGCGNAVVLRHADGLQTSYCHMKQGSILVKIGDPVTAGQQVGSVGLSGFTEYPHLHFAVRKDGKRVDPFDGKLAKSACGAGTMETLWADPPAYNPMDLMPLIFSTKPLTRNSRWQPQAATIHKNAKALILTGRAWNVLKGDRWLFRIIRPDGVEATKRSLTAKENRQSQWYANRLFRPKGGFAPGMWSGKLMVLRQRADGTIMRFESETNILVTD